MAGEYPFTLELPQKPTPNGPMVHPTRRSVNDNPAVSEQRLASSCGVPRASNPGVSVGTTICDIPR